MAAFTQESSVRLWLADFGKMKNNRLPHARPPITRPALFNETNTQLINTMAIAVGTKAPDFTLKSKAANGLVDVTLSANFGQKNTVILFFPLAFTGVCTEEFCDVTQGIAGYADIGAEVIGISVDSPFAQEAWAKKENITVQLVSDLDKKTTAAYGVEFPGLAGIGLTSARAAFVVDKNGVVQYAEQTPTPKDLPNFAAIKAKLAELK